MKRLVYSPSIKVWVKTDSGTIDLSPYVVNCQISRKVDDVSKAEIEFRNPRVMQNNKPRFMFTEHEIDGKVLPVFHPMDPITITLERLSGKPIQVFTGYCDTVPDVQLFPGTAKISASCTLKRLLHTYWDPALPFVNDFMKNYGWELNQKTGQVRGRADEDPSKDVITQTNNLNDSSIANLLYAVLNEVGGWSPANIYIQPLPTNILSIVGGLFDEITKDNQKVNDEIAKLMHDLVGFGGFGTAGASGGTNSDVGDFTGTGKAANSVLTNGQKVFRDKFVELTGLNKGVVTAWMLAEESSSAALARENQKNFNWLNIGWFDTGRGGLTFDATWGTPQAAAKASADFLKGIRFGPSPGIRKIIKTAGQSPKNQISAIQNSGWASGGYSELPSLYNQYGK